MKSKLVAAGLAIGTALLLSGAPARAEVSIHVDISNAPPPPRVVFHRAPHVVYVPESRVYVVNERDYDYDTFHYGAYWYISNAGFWYRSRSYRGPFVVIREDRVPAAIWRVPPARWRHHPNRGGPGYANRRNETVVARDRRTVTVVKEKEKVKDRHERGNTHHNNKK
jgi:hypothetical protein